MISRPHPTAADLATAIARYDAEAVPGEFAAPGHTVRYVAWGEGPTVVMVHGIADLPKSFCMVMGELVDRGYRCVSYDLAHGDGDAANLGMYKHEHFTDDLAALLDHFKLDAADLMGSSFGSTVVLHTAVRHQARVRRMVLQGGFAHRPLAWYERGPSRVTRYWPGRMHGLPLRGPVMRRIEQGQFAGCPKEVYDFLLWCSGRTVIRAAARRALILNTFDLRPRLGEIRQPLLLIGGDRDGVIPRWCEADVEKGVPHATRIEFSPCGHYPQYTMPAPMAEAMDRFLRADDRSVPSAAV